MTNFSIKKDLIYKWFCIVTRKIFLFKIQYISKILDNNSNKYMKKKLFIFKNKNRINFLI